MDYRMVEDVVARIIRDIPALSELRGARRIEAEEAIKNAVYDVYDAVYEGCLTEWPPGEASDPPQNQEDM